MCVGGGMCFVEVLVGVGCVDDLVLVLWDYEQHVCLGV